MKNTIIILLLILILGATLRLWQLGNIPLSPDWDEVALGYNAHSLFTTSRDEFGSFIPPVLRSFDDYKPALYAYLSIPSVAFFGLNTFAVRLPSAIMGIIAILATYFLVKEFFGSRGDTRRKAEILALLAAFLLAISPWHLQFSRAAFETNMGLTFNLLIALFFLIGLKKPLVLFLAALLAGLNLSVYQGERVFTPLLVMALVLIYRKELLTLPKRYLFGAALVGVIALLPTIIFITQNHNALTRFKGTSIFTNETVRLEKSIQRMDVDRKQGDFIGVVFDNRWVTYGLSAAEAYVAHFDPKWIFIAGDIERHHAPRMGLLYLLALPFVLIGIYQLLFGQFNRKTKYFIFSWFLLAPVPAAITNDVPHAVRTLNAAPMYDIFTAIGLLTSFAVLNKLRVIKRNILGSKYICYGLFLTIASFNIAYYLNQYFVQQNYFHAYDWQYGYEKAIPQIETLKQQYKKVVVSEKPPLDQSYMFFLFYLKYPPEAFQKNNRHSFDKYEFRNFSWEDEKNTKDTLFVGGFEDFPHEIKSKKRIFYPSGEPAILIVDPKDNQ